MVTAKKTYPLSRQYQLGGFGQYMTDNASGIGMGANFLGGLMPENSGAGGFLSGAGSGVTAGAAFGPIGALAGGLLGGVAGIFGAKKRREAEEERKKMIEDAKRRYNTSMQSMQSDAILADYDSEGTGTMDFKTGGTMYIPFPYQEQRNNPSNLTPNPTLMSSRYQMGGEIEQTAMPEEVLGGKLQPISDNAVTVKGKQPGMTDNVSIDGGNTFVDHGEVLKTRPDGVDIFSDTLKPPGSKKTFAQLAKSLEKQKKPENPMFEEANARTEMKLDELFEMQQIMNGDSQGETADVPIIPGETPGMGYDPNMNPGANMFINGGKSIYQAGGEINISQSKQMPTDTYVAVPALGPDAPLERVGDPYIIEGKEYRISPKGELIPIHYNEIGKQKSIYGTSNQVYPSGVAPGQPAPTANKPKPMSFKYGGRLKNRTQPSHATFDPDWRRPSKETPAVNPHTTITTFTQSRKESPQGKTLSHEIGTKNKPISTKVRKPTKKSSKKKVSKETQLIEILNTMEVPKLQSILQQYAVGGEYQYGGTDYYNEGMREQMIQVPYPNKKKYMLHGGYSDFLGNDVAHPFGRVGFKSGGKKKIEYQAGGSYMFPSGLKPEASFSSKYGTVYDAYRPEVSIPYYSEPTVGPVPTYPKFPELPVAASKTVTPTGAPVQTQEAPVKSMYPSAPNLTAIDPFGNPELAGVDLPADLQGIPVPSGQKLPEGGDKPGIFENPAKFRDILNTGSMIGEYLFNEGQIDKIPEIPQPRLQNARRLKRININDQINEINRQGRTARLAAEKNTLPGQASSMAGSILAKQLQAKNQALGQRDRTNADIANRETMLNTQIDATNLNKMSQFDADQVMRENSIIKQRSQNFANLMTQARGLIGEANQKEMDTLAMLLRTGADTSGSLEAMFRDNPEMFKQHMPKLYKKLEQKWGKAA